MSTIPKPPEVLDKIVDLVLAHKPKPKSAKSGTAKGTKTKQLHKKRESHKNDGAPKSHR